MRTSFLCGLTLLCAALANSQGDSELEEWNPYSSQVQSKSKLIDVTVDS